MDPAEKKDEHYVAPDEVPRESDYKLHVEYSSRSRYEKVKEVWPNLVDVSDINGNVKLLAKQSTAVFKKTDVDLKKDLVGRHGVQDGFLGAYMYMGNEERLYFHEKWKILAVTLWDGGDFCQQLIAGEPVSLDDVDEKALWTACAVFVWWISDCGRFCLFPSPEAVATFRMQNKGAALQSYAFFTQFWRLNPQKYCEYKIRQIYNSGKAGYHHDKVFGPMMQMIRSNKYQELHYMSDTKDNRSSRHRRPRDNVEDDQEEKAKRVAPSGSTRMLGGSGISAQAKGSGLAGIFQDPFSSLPKSGAMMYGGRSDSNDAGCQQWNATEMISTNNPVPSSIEIEVAKIVEDKPAPQSAADGHMENPNVSSSGAQGAHHVPHPAEAIPAGNRGTAFGNDLHPRVGDSPNLPNPLQKAEESQQYPTDKDFYPPQYDAALNHMTTPTSMMRSSRDQWMKYPKPGAAEEFRDFRGLYNVSQEVLYNNTADQRDQQMGINPLSSGPALSSPACPSSMGSAITRPVIHHTDVHQMQPRFGNQQYAVPSVYLERGQNHDPSGGRLALPFPNTLYHQQRLQGPDAVRTPTASTASGGLNVQGQPLQILNPRALHESFIHPQGNHEQLEIAIGKAVQTAVSTALESYFGANANTIIATAVQTAVSNATQSFVTTLGTAGRSMEEHSQEMKQLTAELKRQQDEKKRTTELMLNASKASYSKFNLPCKTREDLFAFYVKADGELLTDLELLIYAKWLPKSSTGTFGIVNQTLKALLHPPTMFFQVFHEKEQKAGGSLLDSASQLNVQKYRTRKHLKIPMHQMAFIRILFTNLIERARKVVPSVADKLLDKDWTYVQQINSYMRTHRGKIRDERCEINEKTAFKENQVHIRPSYRNVDDAGSTVAKDELEDDLLLWYQVQLKRGTINQNWRIVKAKKKALQTEGNSNSPSDDSDEGQD